MSRRTIGEVLSKEEIRQLVTPSDARGWLSVATTWGLIAGAFALVIWKQNVWTVASALIILGGRHLGLSILMHEAAHRSLFRTRWLNDVVGTWLCAAPSWQDVHRYRTHHLAHHAHTNDDKDPDRTLSKPFPTSRCSLARKLARDLLGITGVKRVVGLLLMDAGFLHYTVAGDAKRVSPGSLSVGRILRNLARQVGPVLVTNVALFAALAVIGHGWVYAVWVAAYLTTFSVFVRVRSIAEHACTERSTDPFRNTRTTRATALARLTVAPHHVNYHLEHHLLPTVPHYRLRSMHKLLRARGVFEDSPYAPGYGAVLRAAVGAAP